jgi:hypothetical protein
MKIIKPVTYLAIIAIVTIFSVLIYATVQQSYRSTANDPQLQVTRDMSERIKNNQAIDHFMMSDTIEISRSLSVFNVLYDNNGQPLKTTGVLDGGLPKMPKGIFDFAKSNGENVFTWQPRHGVRIAMVVKSVQSPGIAFVAAGRSMEEIEKREANLVKMVFMGWILSLAVVVFYWIAVSLSGRIKSQH